MKLVTGAHGFIGREIVRAIERRGIRARGAVRQGERGEEIAVGEIGPDTDWASALHGVDTVVHTAGLAHVLHASDEKRAVDYHAVNVAGTVRLAEQAVQSGAQRFIFLSSIKVNGEATTPGQPFNSADAPSPVDPYGISKWEAERALRVIADRTGLRVVIIRPPLVYGPGIKANFLSMLHWLYRRVPLPFGAVENRRSLVALENLVDLILTCIDHPAAVNKTFLVSDGDDLSTTDLLGRLGKYLDRPARLIRVPPAILRAGMMALGRRDLADRLLGSLQVDISQTREWLGWRPPLSVDAGLKTVADWYLAERGDARVSESRPEKTTRVL